MDGGSGEDLVDYGQRTAPVTVDLAAETPAGEQGEGDEIHGFEDAGGGSAGDRLTGNGATNELIGRGGDDTLVAGGGDDRLYGGSGRDRLDAGDGGDTLFPGAGLDSFSCGLGTDFLYEPVAGERIGRCEDASWDVRRDGERGSFHTAPHPLVTSERVLRFSIGCSSFDSDDGRRGPCSGTVRVREAFGRRRVLGRAVARGERKRGKVRVHVNAIGQRLIRRRQGVFVTVSLHRDRLAQQPLPNVAWTVRRRL
jgi:hypothetical protein